MGLYEVIHLTNALVYLPDAEKTIKPTKIGGIAGGDKFLVGRVLFKFAVRPNTTRDSFLHTYVKVDSSKLFGDDSFAMKVAGHELKGLTACFDAWVPDLSFPLLSFCDYRGFRLIGELSCPFGKEILNSSGMTLLPISEDSLVHGSSNAGKEIRQSAHVVKRLEQLANRLNLRDHPLGGDGRIRMAVPIDLECHDGRVGP